MTVQRISPAYPVENLSAAVELLTALIGEPTFVDGERFAQFDANGARVMLAGADRDADLPFLAIKVDDLDDVVNRLRASGFTISEPVRGPHERRAALRIEGESSWYISVYEPLIGS
ncbi:VOC family protein [Nocardia alni]|uniref:VOC family protein n=1 Tax=Nocardia alni TaxID=2815723 RepID=UPI001C2457D5|nr:VOC family protein [Nocardia alni]